MKALLFAGLLLVGGPALAQHSYKGPEAAAPVKWGDAIILHSADSAKTAYSKAVKALLAAGYGIDKSDKDALFMSTPLKSLDGSVSLALRLVASPTPVGSDITIRGSYTWISAATLMAHVENRQLPVQFVGKSSSAVQQAWAAMNALAAAALPGATIGYK